MRFIDWFRPYRIEHKVCLGCQARQNHIEDLQNLLKSEREGNANLQTLLFQRANLIPSNVPTEIGEQKPLRNIQTTGQLRRMAERKEAQESPDARKDYWSKVQKEFETAGKLP